MNNKPQISFSRWKPIEIMLAVLFLIAPFYYHPNIGGEGLRIPNNITVWMVATIIIWYSLHLVLKRPTFVIPKYFAYIAVFPILITLSGFVTGVEQPLKWLFRLLFIWGGLAFFFSLFQHGLKQGRLDRILFIIVISALLQGLVGVAQIYLQMDMPFWLPKSPNGVPSGLFQQINNQATYQVTAIMIVAYLITRPFIRFAKPWLKVILIFSVLCSSFLVMVSGSRIGALTLVLGLLIIIPTQWQRFKQNKRMALIAVAALVMGIGLGSAVGNGHAIDKTVAMQSGYSGSARLGIYTIALDLIKEEPIFGHGIGSFGRVFQHAKSGFYQQYPKAVLPNKYVSHPHNEMFFWLVEGGLIAGVGLLVVLVGVILALNTLSWQRSWGYVAILLPIASHIQVELPFYISVFHWFLFIILIFILSSYSMVNKTRVMSTSMLKLSSIVVGVLSFILIMFFLHTLRSHQDFMNYYRGENLDLPFKYAFKNPYLSDQAQWVDMNTILNSSTHFDAKGDRDIQHNIANSVKAYIDWGKIRLLNKPNIELYRQLAGAYYFLEDQVNFCSIIHSGAAMYPDDVQLQKSALEECMM